MSGKTSDFDFSFFIGQTVLTVNTEQNLPLGLVLEKASLIIECPWRLRVADEVAIGYSDCLHSPERFSHKNVEKPLMGKKIVDVMLFDRTADLVLEMEDNIFLELFHDSSYFEGWQLRGDNGFYLVSLPGGSIADFT